MSEPLLLAVFKAAHDYSAERRYLGEVTCVSNCAMIFFCGGRSNKLCFNHHLADNRRDRDPAARNGVDGAKVLSGPAGFGREAFNAHGC